MVFSPDSNALAYEIQGNYIFNVPVSQLGL